MFSMAYPGACVRCAWAEARRQLRRQRLNQSRGRSSCWTNAPATAVGAVHRAVTSADSSASSGYPSRRKTSAVSRDVASHARGTPVPGRATLRRFFSESPCHVPLR